MEEKYYDPEVTKRIIHTYFQTFNKLSDGFLEKIYDRGTSK